MPDIKIADYFKPSSTKKYTDYEWRRINEIRDKINSFQDEYEIIEWLSKRRETSFNRQEDLELFGIPLNDTANVSHAIHRNNKWHNGKSPSKNKYDYFKRDRHGNIKRNRFGTPKQYGRLGKKGINFANNVKNSKLAKMIKFIIKNIKAIMFLSLIFSLIIAILSGVIFVSGMVNSIGHSPFILCGQDEIDGTSSTNVNLVSADVEEMSSPEYLAKAVVSVTNSRGWKKNAIIGTLSYILQEGSGMGTFTYESYWCVPGPSGSTNDKTLGNDKWLTWLNSSETAQKSISVNSWYDSSHYAIGLGPLAWSDVWDLGVKNTKNATDFIERANEAGTYWQDPVFSMEDLCVNVEPGGCYTGDSDWKDPKTFTGSADEYCRRVTTFIGMGGYNWTDGYQFIEDHARHVTEAESYYNQYKGNSEVLKSPMASSKDLCESLQDDFTDSNVDRANYQPRLERPKDDNEYYFSNKNIFYASGYGMPNCTAYAYGRAYEILGEKPNLCTGNAEDWFDYNKSNEFYPYGDKPKVGAIAVWSHPGGGHVAVVEKVENGTITFSNSAYNRYDLFFYTNTASVDDPNAYADDSWTLEGYIYI